ncbi:uncharacterized protein LOC117912565 [Vitis riparia]|uniref:uncharacterized protein LOC117912565 n=1 Tax=Vitis riparia TaxID=96939 RepID=UPI00155B3FFE|nr:uncharacterized protein LOC117912565 [Vitis riparia]
MSAGRERVFRDQTSIAVHVKDAVLDPWSTKKGNCNICSAESPTSSIGDSTSSIGSTSLSDLQDDATSSTSLLLSSSSSLVNGPLYELSDLTAILPIKRGLSKYFQGKSKSFISLSNVSCIEHLAKRETPLRRRMKSCKSYGGGLDIHKSSYAPKPILLKKSAKGSFPSLQAI